MKDCQINFIRIIPGINMDQLVKIKYGMQAAVPGVIVASPLAPQPPSTIRSFETACSEKHQSRNTQFIGFQNGVCDVCACTHAVYSIYPNDISWHFIMRHAYHNIQSHGNRAKSSCCSRLLRQLHLFPWSCVLLCILCCYAKAKKAKVLWMLPRAPDCG